MQEGHYSQSKHTCTDTACAAVLEVQIRLQRFESWNALWTQVKQTGSIPGMAKSPELALF